MNELTVFILLVGKKYTHFIKYGNQSFATKGFANKVEAEFVARRLAAVINAKFLEQD